MPVKIPSSLPAVEILKAENIFVMDDLRASTQDIRPLKLLILNLMPLKIVTETDLLRLISNTPLQIELDLMNVSGHISHNTPVEHIDTFYKDFSEIRNYNYDGMIITGAPVERLDFEAVDYWDELVDIFDWAHTHVTSTLYICWAALAGLYHFYGIPKHPLPQKLFGVFSHYKHDEKNPIFRGFDDRFEVPHSRYSEVRRCDIEKNSELTILSESDEAGVYLVMASGGREVFITGHSEYSALTLDIEYRRDRAKGLDIAIPRNYYPGDDPNNAPVVTWRGHANLLFTNWLNYFVYQQTPYNLNDIR